MSALCDVILGHMDLVEQVVANLEVEPGQAEKGVGAILMALRMAVDKPTFEKIRAAVPNGDSYMGRALMSGARTGEMIGVMGPGALMAGAVGAGASSPCRGQRRDRQVSRRSARAQRLAPPPPAQIPAPPTERQQQQHGPRRDPHIGEIERPEAYAGG